VVLLLAACSGSSGSNGNASDTTEGDLVGPEGERGPPGPRGPAGPEGGGAPSGVVTALGFDDHQNDFKADGSVPEVCATTIYTAGEGETAVMNFQISGIGLPESEGYVLRARWAVSTDGGATFTIFGDEHYAILSDGGLGVFANIAVSKAFDLTAGTNYAFGVTAYGGNGNIGVVCSGTVMVVHVP
jgi:hypothetical protein